MRLIPEVLGQLNLQPGLQNLAHQTGQQTTLTGQSNPLVAGPSHQLRRPHLHPGLVPTPRRDQRCRHQRRPLRVHKISHETQSFQPAAFNHEQSDHATYTDTGTDPNSGAREESYGSAGLKADPDTADGGFEVKFSIEMEQSCAPIYFYDWGVAVFWQDLGTPGAFGQSLIGFVNIWPPVYSYDWDHHFGGSHRVFLVEALEFGFEELYDGTILYTFPTVGSKPVVDF